jgi:hypothetical protein
MDGAVATRPDLPGEAPARGPWWRRLALPAIGTLAAAALVLALVRPDVPPLPEDGRNVADEWFDSIARLGIRGVYPPTEDLHVGDLWAVVVPPETEGEEAIAPSRLARSVRIGHIDLSDQLAAVARLRPRLAEPGAETPPPPPGDAIPLSLVMFPAFETRRTTQVAAEGGSWLGAARGTRSAVQTDRMSVPQALSYGIAAGDAVVILLSWCEQRRIQCSARYLEGVVRHALGAEVLGRPEEPRGRVELRLVYYVYLTRRIEHERRVEASVEAAAGVSARGSPLSPQGDAPEGAGARSASSDARGFSVSQVFARPVAIGFRAVSMRPFAGEGGR